MMEKVDHCSSLEASCPTESEPLCEGDTKIFYNVLPPSLAADAFERVREEVDWQRMSHQGGEVPRLVAVQGTVEEVKEEDGDNKLKRKKGRVIPIYRHPSDSSPPLAPFTPAVTAIKDEVERKLGHPVNHVLIQLYRSGTDYISEHSDKTLDICRGSYIANMSLGAERTMVFRTKRQQQQGQYQQEASALPAAATATTTTTTTKRQTTRATLPHNSLCKMGLQTNASWLHGIRQDKRREAEKREEEKAFQGCRISLTFRSIGTFLVEEGQEEEGDVSPLIYGQGAKSKTRDGARTVVNGPTEEAIGMLRGFGKENQEDGSKFDWEGRYGEGFDVLHVTASPRVFFCSGGGGGGSGDGGIGGEEEDTKEREEEEEEEEGCWVEDARVRIGLREMGVGFARGVLGGGGGASERNDNKDKEMKKKMVRFVDVDEARTVVEGSGNVLRYMEEKERGKIMTERVKVGGEKEGDKGGGADDRQRRGLKVFEEVLGECDELVASCPSSSSEAVKEKGQREEAKRRDILTLWDNRLAAAAAAAYQGGQGREQVRFIAGEGSEPSIADFALWPVLHSHIVRRRRRRQERRRGEKEKEGDDDDDDDEDALAKFPYLARYYELMMERNSVKEVLKVSR